MTDSSKKISFGFSKLSKPKVSIISSKKEDKKEESVQFIDCLEDKAIKVKNEELKKPDYLVIPLPKHSANKNMKNSDLLNKILSNSVNEPVVLVENKPKVNLIEENILNKSKPLSLDELAAKEIINDLKKTDEENLQPDNFSVPLTTNAPAVGEKESSLDDYELIPVEKFGVAMLRGMGWAPGKGIGKNEKVVAPKQLVVRPKGLGLGADKVIKKEEILDGSTELKLIKGSFVRIIAGAYKDLFGEVVGFDDESGRLIVKMTLGGSIVTFNEFMIKLVSTDDYHKNCRVINVKKFEEYKSKETSSEIKSTSSSRISSVKDSSSISKKEYKEYSNDSDNSSDESPKKHQNTSSDLRTKNKNSEYYDYYHKRKNEPSDHRRRNKYGNDSDTSSEESLKKRSRSPNRREKLKKHKKSRRRSRSSSRNKHRRRSVSPNKFKSNKSKYH